MLRLNRREVLRFFDEPSATNGFHSAAINAVVGEDLGLGLLVHYLASIGARPTLLHDSPRTGNKSGPRLDGWVKCDAEPRPTLYQVEVKNWNAHSYGGFPLALGAAAETVAEYKRARWSEEWDSVAGRFTNFRVDKVLTRMRPPFAECEIEPLVVYWFAVHPSGDATPRFRVAATGDFATVTVFSMSAYLRSLNDEFVVVEAPRVQERLGLLARLTTTAPAG
jgi:hypothetical protein